MSQTSHSSNGDSEMVTAIVQNLKSRGIFDEFRRECLSDVDTKPSFQNLLQRVDGYVSRFLSEQKWNQSMNKNQLRERLRKRINESGMLKFGIEHLAEQVVSFKINSLFYSKIESVVKEFLGIQEIPLIQTNESYCKTNINKNIKTEENIETKVEPIKVEPKEEKSNEEPQPMDIETDSNSSSENKMSKEVIENSLCAGDSDNGYVGWPTPPQPEMLTPERPELKYSPIEERQDIKENIKLSDDSNTTPIIKMEENETNSSSHEIKENESFLFSKQIIKEEKVTDSVEDNTNTDTKDDNLSDVSSVHTSDLSDFDDEISLDDSNDELNEDSKKKKISLKVVKKITAVLSSEQINDKIDKQMKIENKILKQQQSDEKNYIKQFKSETKRIRKVNPKYASEEFSSIFSEKDRIHAGSSKDETEEESENSNNASIHEKTKKSKSSESHSSDQKLSAKKRRLSNSSDVDLSHKNFKLNKRIEDIPFETRSSSRASADSSLSETTQDSVTSQTRSHKRKVSKTRNESQTQQRYDASDLYKPRPIISSRRTRAPTTPDSNTQSNDDFVIHDLSK